MKSLKKTILVVEDESPLSEAIRDKLKIKGYDSIIAKTESDAEEALKNNKIDLIWLDHYLPGKKNGIYFAKQVKENSIWRKIPIIVVTNTASPDKQEAYCQLGVKKYYTKSNFSLLEIINNISNLLK
ncbi:MAG: response regulator [Patescibacteria group bacterium]|nr:response regulator [Patescibacteria group bacterium]MDD4610982.1 response regulator [Patescibacteria group bacterium]